MRRGLAPLALTVAVLAPATGASAAQGDERLSDERTETRWATPVDTDAVKSEPRAGARTVARLRFRNEDRLPEVYLALVSREVGGEEWVKIRVPRRPNGTTGWVRRDSLGQLNLVRAFLKIDRGTLRATLYRGGRKIWSSRVGVGAPSTPTPAGRFWIRSKLRGMGGVYGPYAFGTSAYSVLSDWPGGGVVGIHGTNQPGLIPGRPSHGCVRLPNAKVRRLARLMPIGTPVRIL
jgi:lipoprotein-anchoring transpeptidase ErfK/SrfK